MAGIDPNTWTAASAEALRAVGGPGDEFFAVELYGIDNTNGSKRWRFFAPWSPAAAFVNFNSSIVYPCVALALNVTALTPGADISLSVIQPVN